MPSSRTEIQQQVDTGAAAIYVWGVAGRPAGQGRPRGPIAKAVELAKEHGLPVGVGGHSLQVPMACEKAQVPCDFYVKTLHSDDYPSATPKELRKEFIWLDGGKGWYDNMWCINPEETIEFMNTVTKPWIAFKVLAAGAIVPREGFSYAFKNGADFIAVGMFDFQVKDNCELARRLIEREKTRRAPGVRDRPNMTARVPLASRQCSGTGKMPVAPNARRRCSQWIAVTSVQPDEGTRKKRNDAGSPVEKSMARAVPTARGPLADQIAETGVQGDSARSASGPGTRSGPPGGPGSAGPN